MNISLTVVKNVPGITDYVYSNETARTVVQNLTNELVFYITSTGKVISPFNNNKTLLLVAHEFVGDAIGAAMQNGQEGVASTQGVTAAAHEFGHELNATHDDAKWSFSSKCYTLMWSESTDCKFFSDSNLLRVRREQGYGGHPPWGGVATYFLGGARIMRSFAPMAKENFKVMGDPAQGYAIKSLSVSPNGFVTALDNQNGAYASMDGGLSWKTLPLPGRNSQYHVIRTQTDRDLESDYDLLAGDNLWTIHYFANKDAEPKVVNGSFTPAATIRDALLLPDDIFAWLVGDHGAL
ncbi:MAG: hypothetical protein ACRC5A_08545, partial [Enterobacteriaceae bacterium]